jgi:hypothetical protein
MTPEQKAEALRLADALGPAFAETAALLRTLAAEPQSKPVAWITETECDSLKSGHHTRCLLSVFQTVGTSVPLYLHPAPARTPLTDAQAERLIEIIDANADESREPRDMRLIRAIERAHAITPPRSSQSEPAAPEA